MQLPIISPRILIIDDDEDDFIITSDFIRQIPDSTFQIDWCSDFQQALTFICAGKYDLYFTDYRLGAHTGMDLLKEAVRLGCEAPIILLTGKGNRKVDMEAMQLGAADYLSKPNLTAENMERCIRYTLGRIQSLQALKASERKYKSIFEKSKDLVFITDKHLNFLDLNQASFEVLGFQPSELLHQNLCALLHQQEQKEKLLAALNENQIINDWELSLSTKNKEQKICILTAAHETDSGGNDYVQGIIHDITTLRKEERLSSQAEKLAATGRLVRTLAHEVRNPLNNITLSAEQLQHEGELPESGTLFLDIIQRNALRIAALIDELLHTSKPSDLNLETQALQSIIEQVVAASLDRITLKKIHLEQHFPVADCLVYADTEKLMLALLNIVINAIEAMKEETGKLKISLQAQSQTALLQIADNGHGISKENLSRLFEPYFTQKRNGLGLGLAFTHNILQAHKARIEVSSSPGAGTQFNITFPLADYYEEISTPYEEKSN
ncbi:MAG: response regulator [Bacteroidetes bacterium]|nr:response regulator [Bacteroidota bacterium]MBS1629913.1 response regulator [Bacteroidota bacterium]